ncbi:4-amino-4-deoxy-L-arabinose transferase [Strigomonas culicis]|uniref:4-amino-4-deoxy-L-arabinose transferase n=1 Tax=Strigomonas culicis TaxID=28005 RepID=S9THL3_9TRYP|nr:4-amino-4-deoxy-L-arabinose transferase [Strigomonas culicis]|eukprot:EPY16404.1 4-amino-4-deoxy-L-arabinose transferase [Strigomonas culicis]
MALTLFVVLKYIVTSFLIVVISEVAKKYDRIGGLIAALPLVTILALIWLYVEGNQTINEKLKNNGDGNNSDYDEDALRNALYARANNHALYTFFYVIPTLPMFLLFPVLFQRKNTVTVTTVSDSSSVCGSCGTATTVADTNGNLASYGFYLNFWVSLGVCAVFTVVVFYIYALILKHYTSIELI